MTFVAKLEIDSSLRFDFTFLRAGAMYAAIAMLLVTPFSYDPIATMLSGMVPWVLVYLLDRPGMPAAIVYYLLWQWIQAAMRLLVGWMDGESIADGIFGWPVYQAFWYSLASFIVLALMFRIALSGVRPSTDREMDPFFWRPLSVFLLFLGFSGLSALGTLLGYLVPGLAQALGVLGAIKYVSLFMLFSTVLSTGSGHRWLLAAMLVEIAVGFGGFFSGFKEVFIVLLLAALAVRIQLSIGKLIGGILSIVLLLVLALFWTAVKDEYRSVAAARSGTQAVRASIADRAEVLLSAAASPGRIDWNVAAESLIRRIAYIDFFGAVIGVTEVTPETESFAHWGEVLEHIAKPRMFFPNKAVVNDIELASRYVPVNLSDDGEIGTSISLGYLAENFIDFGFPGMLLPVAGMGLLLAAIVRYFMKVPLPWIVREGCVTALVLGLNTGMELSLVKFLGGILTTFVVLAFFLRVFMPGILRLVRK